VLFDFVAELPKSDFERLKPASARPKFTSEEPDFAFKRLESGSE
jgi:hypothetical protein